MRKAFQKFVAPSKVSINMKEDTLRAAVLLDCYDYCVKNNVLEPTHADIESFKNEYAGLSRMHIAPRVEQGIRSQLVKMFEAVDAGTDYYFSIATGESSIPGAGQGVFIESNQDIVPGTVVALYPGRVYQKFELLDDNLVQSLMPDDNFMLMLRRDDNLIDPRNLDGVPFNPFAFGHFINHCGAARKPNVYQLAFDFQEDVAGRKSHSFPKHLRHLVPNIYANKPSLLTKMGNLGHFMKGLVFMTTRPIKNGEELLFDYRLVNSPALPWPEWYEPASANEEEIQQENEPSSSNPQ